MSTPAPTDAEKSLSYLLTVFSNTVLPRPDFKTVATQAGVNNANNAQKKFRKIILAHGFDLVNNQVVNPNGDGDQDGETTPATPKTPAAKKAGIGASGSGKKRNSGAVVAKERSPPDNGLRGRKRKRSVVEEEEHVEEGGGRGVKEEERYSAEGEGDPVGVEGGLEETTDDDEVEVVAVKNAAGRARSLTVKPDPGDQM